MVGESRPAAPGLAQEGGERHEVRGVGGEELVVRDGVSAQARSVKRDPVRGVARVHGRHHSSEEAVLRLPQSEENVSGRGCHLQSFSPGSHAAPNCQLHWNVLGQVLVAAGVSDLPLLQISDLLPFPAELCSLLVKESLRAASWLAHQPPDLAPLHSGQPPRPQLGEGFLHTN